MCTEFGLSCVQGHFCTRILLCTYIWVNNCVIMLWHCISGMVQWDQAEADKNGKVGISHAAEELQYLLWRGCDGVWTEFDRGDSVFRTVYWAPHCILQRTEELLLCAPYLSGKTTRPVKQHSRYSGSCLANNTPLVTCVLPLGWNNPFVYSLLQEFMAALYVFTMFRSESKNVLDSEWLHMPSIFISKPDQTRSVVSLLLRAVELTLRAPLGHYDMFLRFLCGLLSPDCHDQQLVGFLFPNDAAKVSGLDEAQQLLEQTVTTAQQNNTDRVENLKECLREMIQLHKWAAWWTLAWLDYFGCFIGKVQSLFCKYQH